jgi:hypothetical protein
MTELCRSIPWNKLEITAGLIPPSMSETVASLHLGARNAIRWLIPWRILPNKRLLASAAVAAHPQVSYFWRF